MPGTRLSQMYPNQERVVVNSIHHQGIKNLAPGFEIEAWSHPDGVPEAIRRRPQRGRGYIAATQWHPEFFKPGSSQTMDDAPILDDFLAACSRSKVRPLPGHSPFQIQRSRRPAAAPGPLLRR